MALPTKHDSLVPQPPSRRRRTSASPLSLLGQAALAYAALGYAVFPCAPISKEPTSGSNGVSDATTDPAQITQWWLANPDANIGFEPASAGMLALDFDPGSDRVALARQLGGLPETKLRSRTPRGGTHEFYALADGEVVPPSASKIAPHVDVRSYQSYVLLPPSRTADGEYEWLSEGKPHYRTDELLRVASSAREKHPERDNWIIEPDLPENIEAAVEWLTTKAQIAIEGQGGDHTALATAAMMRSYGLSEDTAFQIMVEDWNPKNQPPWSGAETDHLRQKVENAYRYATSPPGNITPAYKLASTKALFTSSTNAPALGREGTAGRFRVVDRDALEAVTDPAWLIEGTLPLGAYALLLGAPGSFKTFAALDIALSIANPFASDLCWNIAQSGPVLFAVGEGRSALKNRVAAWERLHMNGARASDFVLIDPVPSVAAGEAEWTAFINAAKGMHETYKLVVVDTVGRSMQSLNENSQEHASTFTKLVERLQRELSGAVLGLHHTGHEAKDRARGSSVFGADADTVLRLDREAKERTVSMAMLKQKDGPEWEQPKVLKLSEVLLHPGASSLAVAPASAADIQRAQAATVSRDETPAAQDMNTRFILAALRSIPAKKWSNTELAVAARQLGCKIPLNTLRQALGRHRHKLGWATCHVALAPYYNRAAERWETPARGLPSVPAGYELDDNVPLPTHAPRSIEDAMT
jgi:hypothetical protein